MNRREDCHMVAKTFSARVVGGQLCYQEPLDAFEGQTVRVTVAGAASFSPPQSARAAESGDGEPPEWMAVEADVYAKMPFSGEVLKEVVIVEGGPLRPSLIFPEDLPDE